MARRLEGQIAVVTGGTTGIGLATAKRFATEGARVFVTGRRQAELDAAVEGIGPRATGVQADSANLSDLNRPLRAREDRGGPHRRAVRQCRRRLDAAVGVDYRRAVRRHVRPQREGRALHGAEGVAASGGRRLSDPHRFQRQHQGHPGVQRL